MQIKKFQSGGQRESGETHQISILEVEILVFTNIQSISTLLILQLDDNGS